MKNKEAKRHHYIPQFILRNFCFDEKENVKYFNKHTKNVEIKNIRNIFMEKDLYRDEINCGEDPTQLEKDFSKYENDISRIVKRMLNDDEIILTSFEYESLKLFLAISGMRTKNAKEMFGDTKENELFYKQWQENGNINDLWKRNLEHLVKCRSLKEVIENDAINKPIKQFVIRDTFGLKGKYFVVVEQRGEESFVLGDCCPLTMISNIPGILLYNFFPLSPNRMLIVVDEIVSKMSEQHTVISKQVLKKHCDFKNGETTIKVRKMYKPDIKYINEGIKNASKEGYIFKCKD
jgi:hypothetical protein